MQGIPKILSTKKDFEYIRSQNLVGWQDSWMILLEGRFAIHEDDLVEDQNAPLHRLGMSVADVSKAIGFTGLTSREIKWREDQPDRWALIDGQWQEIEGWSLARSSKRLAEAKAKKKDDIQDKKRAIRDGGILVSGVIFDTDGLAQTMYTQFMVGYMVDPKYTVPAWKASGETFVIMTGALVNAIKTAWSEMCIRVHEVQDRKIADINAMQTIAEVEAYDVSTGWDR